MVTLEEIKKKRKLKVLLKGPMGVGKTFTCMKIVDIALSAGKRVLYLDHERGAIEEIIAYFEDNEITELENFVHEDYFNFGDLVNNIKRYTVDASDKVDLIVIDPLPLLHICRLSATAEIKQQGFYYMGEKVIKLEDIKNVTEYTKRIDDGRVDNKSTYSLRGWQYQLPNDWEMSFKDTMVSIPVDIVVTLLLPDEKNTLDPSFDYVIELAQAQVSEPRQQIIGGKLETIYESKKVYKGIPRKIRGERIHKIEEMNDPWKAIVKPFYRKYMNEEPPEL